jgi:hypothetical protein
MTTPTQIVDAAMALDANQRAEVAHQLLLSLEPDDFDADADSAWAGEIRQRLQGIRDGRVILRDWDEALHDIRQSLVSKTKSWSFASIQRPKRKRGKRPSGTKSGVSASARSSWLLWMPLCSEFGDDPLQFPTLETLSDEPSVRRFLLKRFPFAIVYEVVSSDIQILAVAHARRRPQYWKKRR